MRLFKKYEDFFLKLTAVFFATLLWFFVALQDKVSREIPARIICRDLPPRTVLLRCEPSTVKVKVIGPRSLFRALPDRPRIIVLDLSHLRPGLQVIRLTPDQVPLPSGLQVEEVQPSRVEVLLDRVVIKWIKVVPQFQGQPEKGYVLDRVRVSPPSVRVKGARSVLARLQALSTYPIDLSHRKESFEVRVPLEIPEGVMHISPDKVQVQVYLRRGG
ncbi:CdaR family protein [Thermosulfurimonas sp.]|uniref:CdaR family protein n=1 Tax=Thermosulfurimonas sp. TaxID=2080236 RepID=UPI0025D1904C|nr:CdaR family protein [Thermosulfurimonas sp.]